MRLTLDHPDIKRALHDLRRLLQAHSGNIDAVELFGSTLRTPMAKARDIDFFVAFRRISFEELRTKLMDSDIGRHVVVESLEASYSNCPLWELHTPLTLHLILYRQGISSFSAKLTETRSAALDVTKRVLGRE